MSSPRRAARSRILPLLLFGALCGALCGGCAEDAGMDPVERELIRERASAHAGKQSFGEARVTLAPLVEIEEAETEDLLRAAAVEFALSDVTRAEGFLDRAAERAPESPALHYLRGQIARESGQPKKAVDHFRAAHAAAPEDVATRYFLASVLHDLERTDEAEEHYKALIELGLENAGNYYASALFRLERLYNETGRDEEWEEIYTLRQFLANSGVTPTSEQVLRLGTFGAIPPPEPSGNRTEPTRTPPRFVKSELELPGIAKAIELHAYDLDGDWRMDLLARTPEGIWIALQEDEGWIEEQVVGGDFQLAIAFDLDNVRDNPWQEIAVVSGAELRVLVRDPDGNWKDSPGTIPPLPGPPQDMIAVDMDHEADMDLFIVGPFGARLYRNDGADRFDGAFTDVSLEAMLPGSVAYQWCSTEDLDRDNDVDLIAGGSEGTWIGDSLRAGRFRDASERLGSHGKLPSAPILADFNGDSRPDFWVPGNPSTFLAQAADGNFAPSGTQGEVPQGAVWIDIDLDGAGDLCWDGGARLAAGLEQARATSFEGWPSGAAPRALAFADFDGDLLYDGLRIDDQGVHLLLQAAEAGHGKLIRLSGVKDNQRAVGAILEVRSGEIYRRIYYRGEQVVVGVGPHESVDVLRIRWPNGVVQTELDQPLGGAELIDDPDAEFGDFIQVEGLVGSCPFLYSWNGTKFEFISDVLGITPLGLPMAPGMLVPPDHDEYVLVRGDQLAPRDGRFVLQFTEELREVTYLDQARLLVVDHPEGTEVFPNELFRFPPFPEAHTHTLRDPLLPKVALASDGRDWAQEIATLDDVHAAPFVRERTQLQGIAEPWWIQLEFDPERVAEAKKLRLVMTGWFRWSNASVNMAIARIPGVDFVPPILELAQPGEQGGEEWLPTGPPLGFPAGKPKTMVVDITHLLPRLKEDPRLRLTTSLQLCWDRIALAVDDDDAELRVTTLEPLGAELWERGFSAEIEDERLEAPERFDWDRKHMRPRWDQHPGMYTRFGDCMALVDAVDDRYVIMGTGDALRLEFDATEVPRLAEGFTRDYLLFLDGWAKDRDPNAIDVLEVEPLPFHAMSGYPYGADEGYPDDEEHRLYRAEWNTRPARRWIEPLSPLARNAPAPLPSSAW